jgi:hypothetical protein
MADAERDRPVAAGGDLIDVEVAYATPRQQLLIGLRLPQGTTVAEAIERSGMRARFRQIGPEPPVGIFGRKVGLEQQLRPGDRVEIYRPLMADPKEVRRQKANTESAGIRASKRGRPSRGGPSGR